MGTHSTVVELSQRAFAVSVAAHIYDQTLLEEQRVLRELKRVQERLQQVRQEKLRYGRMIGME
jgi:hypothetical protein